MKKAKKEENRPMTEGEKEIAEDLDEFFEQEDMKNNLNSKIEGILEEFDKMFPSEKEEDFFRFKSYRLVIRNFISRSLTQFASEITESILVEKKRKLAKNRTADEKRYPHGWNACLSAIKAKRDRLFEN